MKIARITTVPAALVHFTGHIPRWRDSGAEVHLISSPVDSQYWDYLTEATGAQKILLDIPRDISPWRDLKALVNLFFLFRREKYDVVHSTTPKASLLVALAGFLARVPIRLHTYTGQRWATLKGPLRFLLRKSDWLVSFLNTATYADSHSQVEFLVNEKAVVPSKITCLKKGCLSGIDLKKFNKSSYDKAKLREEFKLKANDRVIIYVGRMTQDKGVEELTHSFVRLQKEIPQLHLFLLGIFESPLDAKVKATLQSHPQIHYQGFHNEPQKFLALADFFCMPSYREGFGTVILEAAAFGLPSVGTSIPGLIDAIVPEETGLLIPVKDEEALYHAMKKLALNSEYCELLGKAAYERVRKDFQMEFLSDAMWAEYVKLMGES